MNRQVIPNGWHCDALPDGTFAVLVPDQHVLTNLGPIEFPIPQRQPLFVRLKSGALLTFAGQAWKTGNDETLEYHDFGVWAMLPKSIGVSPVIYDNAGKLVINNGSAGSQGYRYVDSATGRIVTGDETYGPMPNVAPDLYEWTQLSWNGDHMSVGQGSDENGLNGGVIVWDGTTHRVLAQGRCRFIRAHRQGDQVSIAFYRELGGTDTEAELVWATVDELRALPPLPAPVPDVFAPLGPPRKDGDWIEDLAPYFFGAPETFPRTYPGPSGHPIHQHVIGSGDSARYFFMKFGPQVGLDRYEEERLTKDYIHQIVDASNEILSSISDTRWYPRRMQVGLDYCWEAPLHEIHERRRDSCQIFNRWGFFRKQGIYQSWPRFSAGKDFPDCDVTVVYYDNTNGVYAKDRLIELGYKGKGIGNLRWEAHRSDLAMATGRFVPSDATLAVGDDGVPMRKNFYHKGGPSWVPAVSACPLPMSPDHPDPPIPPIPPMPPATDTLRPGDILKADAPLVSQDQRFRLLYQLDGNLVLYGPSGPMWDSRTNGHSVGFCPMQGDGNFVVYDKSTRPRWASNTNGNHGAWLLVQNDGNVVLYSTTGLPLWATGTVYQAPPIPIPPIPIPGPVEPPVQIRVEGKVFRRPDGAIYQAKSASSFLLLRRLLEEGEAPVREYLARFYAIGARELRVFSRVNWNGNPGPGLFPEQYPNYWQAFNRLFTLAAEQGMYLEMVALTGPEVGTGWVQQCQEQRSKHVNAFLEIANEPPVNGIDIERIMAELGSSTASWAQPWATGQYYPTALPSGTFCTVHTDRVDGWEWVRKAIKDILEYREGGGPYEPTDPKMDRPIVGDEPMGAASFHSPGRRDNVPVHHFTAAAGSMLFGAGYCVHHESGLRSTFPEGVELDCVAAAFKGMDCVGPDWQLGEYGRVGLSHFPIPEDPSVRTYGMRLGNRWKVVRVGPTTAMPVVAAGWRVDKVDSFAGLNVVLELVQ